MTRFILSDSSAHSAKLLKTATVYGWVVSGMLARYFSPKIILSLECPETRSEAKENTRTNNKTYEQLTKPPEKSRKPSGNAYAQPKRSLNERLRHSKILRKQLRCQKSVRIPRISGSYPWETRTSGCSGSNYLARRWVQELVTGACVTPVQNAHLEGFGTSPLPSVTTLPVNQVPAQQGVVEFYYMSDGKNRAERERKTNYLFNP